MDHSSFDLVLRGGTVYDGLGGAPQVQDIGLRDGRIAALGDLSRADAPDVIDVAGLAVAPGFVNCHSHSDETILDVPGADSVVAQGITTEVIGNCGFGPTCLPDVAAFRDAVLAQGTGVNLALLAPHGTLRAAVGQDRAAMLRAVDRCLGEGCIGVSLGLEYDPGSRADIDELTDVARRAAAHDKPLTVHMRNEDDRLLEAVDEVLEVARRAQVQLQVSHLKACGRDNWGRAFDALERIDAARAQGLRVGYDRYPYTAVMTTIGLLLPAEAWWIDADTRNQRLASGEYRPALLARLLRVGGPTQVRLARCAARPDLAGQTLDVIARMLGKPVIEATEQLLRETGDDGDVIIHSIDEGETLGVLARCDCMVCTDAAVRPLAPQANLHPHPRAFGSMPRFLGRYVRELGATSLPAAIRQLTNLPAEAFGLRDRGRLAPGLAGDVVVFDPKTIADTSTFEQPWAAPAGIALVLVNGRPVVRDNAPTGTRPGVFLE